jgi:gamma-glutamyltranspeptidase/glutathione hydrolase
MNKLKSILCFVLVFVMVFAFCACEKPCEHDYVDGTCTLCGEADPNYNPNPGPGEEPTDFTDLSVRNVTAQNGISAAASAYASKAGVEVLEAGGNAFDAAVAVAFALSVVEPNHTGIGGGGKMIGYDAASGEVVSYGFREFAIEASATYPVNDKDFYDNNLKRGGKSVGVPTEVAGLIGMYNNLGSGNVTLEQVLAPAIRFAEEGFVVAASFAGSLDYKNFTNWNCDEAKQIYGNGLRAYRVGETVKNQNQANVLKAIAENGLEGFYGGWVAEAILEAVAAKGGLMTQADLDYAKTNYPIIEDPISTSYSVYGGDTYNVYATNGAGAGGIALLEMFNLIEHYTHSQGKALSTLGHNSAEYMHVVGSAIQYSFADRRAYVGGTKADVPVVGLISKGYAAARWDNLFNPNSSCVKTSSYDYGGVNGANPWEYQGSAAKAAYDLEETPDYGTSSFVVTDKDGNCVSIVKTINSGWGSYVMPANTGFFLNNVMTNFSYNTEALNGFKPYKSPASYMSPALIMQDGLPVLLVGSPGSERIPMAVLQVALNVIEFGMPVQDAINAARISNSRHTTSDFNDIRPEDIPAGITVQKYKLIDIEQNFVSADVLAQLLAMNYYVNPNFTDLSSHFGGVQAIKINYNANGVRTSLEGGADPRRDGKALGY